MSIVITSSQLTTRNFAPWIVFWVVVKIMQYIVYTIFDATLSLQFFWSDLHIQKLEKVHYLKMSDSIIGWPCFKSQKITTNCKTFIFLFPTKFWKRTMFAIMYIPQLKKINHFLHVVNMETCHIAPQCN